MGPFRRRPFALPSHQELAESGVVSRASDAPDEASSHTTSHRSAKRGMPPGSSAANPIFGSDRPQGRVTVHENLAAWLADSLLYFAAIPTSTPVYALFDRPKAAAALGTISE